MPLITYGRTSGPKAGGKKGGEATVLYLEVGTVLYGTLTWVCMGRGMVLGRRIYGSVCKSGGWSAQKMAGSNWCMAQMG